MNKKIIICTTNKIKNFSNNLYWIDAIIIRKNPGYDFSSWKCAFIAFPDLFTSREITLCNDSVFSPINSYKEIYNKMEKINCDFWGITSSNQFIPHLQSYHIVLKKKVIKSNAFFIFIMSIPNDSRRSSAIELELKFGIWLESQNLKPGVYIEFLNKKNPHQKWEYILELGCPVFKREHISRYLHCNNLKGWYDTLNKYKYPVNLIRHYFYRIGIDISVINCFGEKNKNYHSNIFKKQKKLELIDSCCTYIKKTSIIFHCFYPYILYELKKYIYSLPRNIFLFISTDSENKKNLIYNFFKKNNFKNIEIRIFPNRGWDIAPFIVGFSDIINEYDIILKIHAKASTYATKNFSTQWREEIYSSLIGNRKRIMNIINYLQSNESVGMIAPPNFLGHREISQSSNSKKLISILNKWNIPLTTKDAIDFPAGSMFWCKNKSLEPLRSLNLTFDDFEPSNTKIRDGDLAHTIERLFFFSCFKSGYSYVRIPPNPYCTLKPLDNQTV